MQVGGAGSGERLACRVAGLDLVNPVICGSGEHVITASGIQAALSSGVAVVVAKSVNLRPEASRQLTHAEYAFVDEALGVMTGAGQRQQASLSDSIFCRSGLRQADPEWFAMLAGLDRNAKETGRYVAASIVLSDLPEATGLATMADQAGLRILELNIGAPHSAAVDSDAISAATEPERVSAIVERIRAAFPGSLWIKLTGLQADVSDLVAAAARAGADAVCVSGRLMGFMPDLETLEPALGTLGAWGGRWALPLTCRHLAVARRKVGPGYSLLGTNGARSGLDVARLILAGACAAELTSLVFLRGFMALGEAIRELEAWLTQRDLKVADLVGLAADRLEGYAARANRIDEWRQFVPQETVS